MKISHTATLSIGAALLGLGLGTTLPNNSQESEPQTFKFNTQETPLLAEIPLETERLQSPYQKLLELGFHPKTGMNQLGWEQKLAIIEALKGMTLEEIKTLLEQIDPELAFSLENQALIVLAFDIWAEANTDAALAYLAGNFLPAAAQERVALRLIKKLSHTDPSRAMDWVEQNVPDSHRVPLQHEIVVTLAKTDPPAALQLAKDRAGAAKTGAMVQTLDIWADINPEAAINWLRSIQQNEQFSGDANNVTKAFAMQHPQHTPSVLEFIPPGNTRTEMLQIFSSQFARDEIENAMQWAEKLPEEADRRTAREVSLSVLAMRAPKAAFDQLQSMDLSPQERANLRAAISNISAYDDPLLVQKAIAELDPDQQPSIIKKAAAGGYRTHPSKTLEWIETLPSSHERDTALSALSDDQFYVMRDPLQSIELAAMISDPELRFNKWQQSVLTAAQSDPSLAEDLLKHPDIDEHSAKALSAQIDVLRNAAIAQGFAPDNSNNQQYSPR